MGIKLILNLCLAAGLGTLLSAVVFKSKFNNLELNPFVKREQVGLNLLVQQLEEVAEQTSIYHTVIVNVTASQKLLYLLPGQELTTSVKALCRIGTTNWSINPENKTIQLATPAVLKKGCQIDEENTKALAYRKGVEILANGLDISQKSRLAALEEARRLASEPMVLDAAKRQLEAGLAPFVADGWRINYIDSSVNNQ